MSEKDDNRGVRRALRVLRLLKGRTLTGLTLTEIAKGIGENASTVLRTLQSMQDEQFIRQLETGRWALDVELLAIATAHQTEFARATTRIDEIASRVRAQAVV